MAAHYPDFPILLETYRECLRDVFDLRGLKEILRDVERRAIRVRSVRTAVASPFASTLMFNYVGGFIYDGDAPLAERRAAALTLDHAQLRELLSGRRKPRQNRWRWLRHRRLAMSSCGSRRTLHCRQSC